jgi:methylase of polypeptide subunit release factors
MTAPVDPWDGLEPAPAPVAFLREWLDRIGYDQFQQIARPDYFTSPFPDRDLFSRRLTVAPAPLATAMRLLLLADPMPAGEIVSGIGLDAAEALVEAGLLAADAGAETLSTGGRSLVSWLGSLLVVSTNPRYPSFREHAGEVYMGPDSLTLAAEVVRRSAGLPSGECLDLCSGSGMAGLVALARGQSGTWTAVDRSHQAIRAARFNAALNGWQDRYLPLAGDLYAPVEGRTFDLITCNPPFIPVPAGHAFPVYGDGGEDGTTVLRPLLDGLASHLAKDGMALIYAEGTGDPSGPFIREELASICRRDGLDVTLRIVSSVPATTALFTLGQMLSAATPSRLDELDAWTSLFERSGAERYLKYLLAARHGTGSLEITSLAI